MLFLVTNDDGIHSEGISMLAEGLSSLGEVFVVAPDRERSAASHALTLHRPVRVKRVSDNRFSIDGTPTDCVNLAINRLMSKKPDFVISGINHGANLGEDVTYSGTVAAAMEGTLLRVQSIAVSALENGEDDFAFEAAAEAACRLVKKLSTAQLPEGTLLNVNVSPDADPGDLQFEWTWQGKRIYSTVLEEKLDPRGRSYYWMGGDRVTSEFIKGTDCHVIDTMKRVSVTPIQLDFTNYGFLDEMKKWKL